MASIDDKISAAGFILHTTKTFDEVRKLGATAAQRSTGVMTKTIETDVEDNASIEYVVKRAGIVTVLSFGLVYSQGENGATNTVILVPGNYMTSRAAVFFIPVGPKDAAGFLSLKKFSDNMRASLTKAGGVARVGDREDPIHR